MILWTILGMFQDNNPCTTCPECNQPVYDDSIDPHVISCPLRLYGYEDLIKEVKQ